MGNSSYTVQRSPSLTPQRLDRLLAGAVQQENGCWIWKRSTAHHWPTTTLHYGKYRADRAIYEQLRGAIPDNHTLEHSCGNLLCVGTMWPGATHSMHWGSSTTEARFLARIDKSGECWLWTGAFNSVTGYGYLTEDRKPIGAHRYSYLHHFGEIPAGQFVLHRCDVPRCVRPDHLFLGTQAENMADMIAKGRGCDLTSARQAKAAWASAVRTLIAAHEDEFNALWDMERKKSATA